MMNFQIKAIILIALLTLVTACSFKTLYNKLDYLIPSYVDGMVSLDNDLEEQVEQRTSAFINWHRNSQLNQYADWLRALQRDAGPRVTEQDIQQRIIEMEQFWRSISIRINDELAQLLPLLNNQQLNELFLSIEDKNETFREKYVDLDEEQRVENYFERITENYENWIGSITDEQELEMKRAASELVSMAEQRLQRRHRWQLGIQDILNEDVSAQDKSERLREFMTAFEEANDDAMKEKSEINNRVISRLTVHVSHNMTEKQKAFFINKTNSYIRMFTELAENQ